MLKALSENLALLASMVLLVGLSSTEAYYAYFGLSYQTLDLPSDHIAYRGLTAVFGSTSIVLLYLLALAAVAGQSLFAHWLRHQSRLQWLNCALVVLFVFAAWWGGRYAGQASARTDATMTSTLPLLSRLETKSSSNGTPGPTDGLRLLLHGSEGLYVFRPVANDRNETPLVKFISSDQIEGFDLCAHC
jgi:hypothetical protein